MTLHDDVGERVAIALAEARCWPGCWENASEVERKSWLRDARAALAELAKTHDLRERKYVTAIPAHVAPSPVALPVLAVGQVWVAGNDSRQIDRITGDNFKRIGVEIYYTTQRKIYRGCFKTTLQEQTK